MKMELEFNMDNPELRGTNMDERLKYLASKFYEIGIKEFVENKYIPCVKIFLSMYMMIKSYEFDMKAEADELGNILSKYIGELITKKPRDTYELIQLQQAKYEFATLVVKYIEMVVGSYKELGIWFKTSQFQNDPDLNLSKKTFNDDITHLEQRKKELLGLKPELLVELMTPSTIHICWARLQMKNDLQV